MEREKMAMKERGHLSILEEASKVDQDINAYYRDLHKDFTFEDKMMKEQEYWERDGVIFNDPMQDNHARRRKAHEDQELERERLDKVKSGEMTEAEAEQDREARLQRGEVSADQTEKERRERFSSILGKSSETSPADMGSLDSTSWKSQMSQIRKSAQGELDINAFAQSRHQRKGITHPSPGGPGGASPASLQPIKHARRGKTPMAQMSDDELQQQYAHHLAPPAPLGEPLIPLGMASLNWDNAPAKNDAYAEGFGHMNARNVPVAFNASQAPGVSQGGPPKGFDQLYGSSKGGLRHDMSIVEKEPALKAIKDAAIPKAIPQGAPGVVFTHMLREPKMVTKTINHPSAMQQASPPPVAPAAQSNEYLDSKAQHARKLAAKLRSMGAEDEAKELDEMARALDKKIQNKNIVVDHQVVEQHKDTVEGSINRSLVYPNFAPKFTAG